VRVLILKPIFRMSLNMPDLMKMKFCGLEFCSTNKVLDGYDLRNEAEASFAMTNLSRPSNGGYCLKKSMIFWRWETDSWR